MTNEIATENTEVVVLNEDSLRDKIHIVRGQKVMLDFDLAEIYGYTTSAFNQQVRRNESRFPNDFRFQLTENEFQNLLSQNVTARWGGDRRINPWVFTEQGVYMLMSILKGDLAIQQSVALIRLFKQMKDYIVDTNQPSLLANYIGITPKDGAVYFLPMDKYATKEDFREMKDKMLTKDDLPAIIRAFDENGGYEEHIFLEGQPLKADLVFQKIFRKAKKSIVIIDDYIGLKTLHHLAAADNNVAVTVISDNMAHPPLTQTDYQDYQTENPGRAIIFLQNVRAYHDRYIWIDGGTKGEILYHCGPSVKDSGKRIAQIDRVHDISIYLPSLTASLSNPPLILR